MSDATSISQYDDSTAEGPAAPTIAKTLRVWPAVLMLAAFWAFLYANHNVDMSMFARFISRIVAYGILLLLFLGWWLTRRSVRWRDRLLAIAAVILGGVATSYVVDKSIDPFGLFLGAFPILATVWVAWIAVARSLSPAMQRVGFCVAMLAVFSYFAMLRFDGLDSLQRAEMSWRWTPTNEQEFLAGRDAAAKLAKSAEAAGLAEPWILRPGDSPAHRGPQRDGVIRGLQLAADWKEHPPKLLWRERVGPGWSGLIVVDDHIVTQEQRGEAEAVACYDAKTGKEMWAHEDAVRFEEGLSGAGPRGTPTFADGRIYALGAKGNLNCLAAETGAVVWSHDIVADAEVLPAEMPQWGYSVSPLVVDGLVIVFAGGTHDKSILAYRAEDGELAWSRAAGKQSYSSPQLVTLSGQRQVVMHDNHALTGLNPADGAVLWEHPSASEMAMPMLQPHQTETGELVISTEPGAALLDVKHDSDKWSVTPRWTTNQFRPGFNDFVLHKGHLYGLDDGILCCFDLATGKRLWKKGRYGHGQILLLPERDELVLSSDTGEIIHFSAGPKGQKELGRFQAIEGKTWNSPVIIGNRLFLRNGEEMAAYELSLPIY